MSRRAVAGAILLAGVIFAASWYWFGPTRERELASAGERRAFTTIDSWHSPNAMSDFHPPGNDRSLGNDRFAVVVESLQSEAQEILAEVPAKRITAAEAARFAGHPLPADTEHVLLRGLVLNEGNGGFSVYVNGATVEVHHGCLGRHPLPMRRKVVVAVLPRFPESVFVSCSMAE